MVNINRAWLLNAYPDPIFIPKPYETVRYSLSREFGEGYLKAFVVTQPRIPEVINDLDENQFTKPCNCDILVGSEIVKDVDVSYLSPLVPVEDDDDEDEDGDD